MSVKLIGSLSPIVFLEEGFGLVCDDPETTFWSLALGQERLAVPGSELLSS